MTPSLYPSDRPANGALSGIRVLDYTTAWAGTRMTTYLAEMGAEVIHVESVQYLDTHRGWSKWAAGATGLFPNNEPGRRPWERNSQYNEFNKNKLGITLNLADKRGVELFKRLAAISDVVVDNYKAGTVSRFGVDFEALRKSRPDVVCVSIPAFGTTGPYSQYTAWGNQVSAIAGHALLLNYEDDDEPEPGGTYADPIAAIIGAFSVVAALVHRQRTGQGQYIEIALAEVMPGLLPEPILDFSINGRIAKPLGNRNPDAAPWGVYPCAGVDEWIAICCVDDRDFAALCACMNRLDLLEDARFASITARVANHVALDAILRTWTADHDKWHLADKLQDAGIASEPATTFPDMLTDPQLVSRDFFHVLEHPESGRQRYPLQATRLSKTDPVDYRAAPTYGQHNEAVLTGLLGLDRAELPELEAAEIIGDQPLEDEVRRVRGRSGGA